MKGSSYKEICINYVILPKWFFFLIHILVEFTRLINVNVYMCCDITSCLGFHDFDCFNHLYFKGF